jgi:hypothetical protein
MRSYTVIGTWLVARTPSRRAAPAVSGRRLPVLGRQCSGVRRQWQAQRGVHFTLARTRHPGGLKARRGGEMLYEAGRLVGGSDQRDRSRLTLVPQLASTSRVPPQVNVASNWLTVQRWLTISEANRNVRPVARAVE